MIVDASEIRLRRRLSTFRDNLDRAKSFAKLATVLSKPNHLVREGGDSNPELSADVGLFSVVAAIASLDELIKGISFEVILGYLSDEISPPGRIRIEIPLVAARAFTDAQAEDLGGVTSGQQYSLAIQEIFRNQQNENFQSYESIARKIKELGLGSASQVFSDGDFRDRFKKTVNKLARQRHEIVHRFGVEDHILLTVRMGSLFSSDNITLSTSDADVIQEGGEALVQYIQNFVRR